MESCEIVLVMRGESLEKVGLQENDNRHEIRVIGRKTQHFLWFSQISTNETNLVTFCGDLARNDHNIQPRFHLPFC